MPGKGLTLIGDRNTKARLRLLKGSETKDWANMTGAAVGANAHLQEDVTVVGASIGDIAFATMSVSTLGLVLAAQVTAANVVTCTLVNVSNVAQDIASGTLTAWVLKNVR